MQNQSKVPARAMGCPTWVIPGLDILSISVDYTSFRILESDLRFAWAATQTCHHGALVWPWYITAKIRCMKQRWDDVCASTLLHFFTGPCCKHAIGRQDSTAGAPRRRHHKAGQSAIMRAAIHLRIRVAGYIPMKNICSSKIQTCI